MKRSFAAAVRRTSRLMRPPRPARSVRKVQKAVTSAVIDAVLAPIAVMAPKPARSRKPAAAKARIPGTMPKRLRKAKSLVAKATGAAPAPRTGASHLPEGAKYLSRTHHCTAGSRSYRLYLPASRPKRAVGLIVMLHGCYQDPDDFARGTHMNALAEKHGLAIAYPEQTGRNNAAACWNWFKPSNQARGGGEPEILASIARKLMKEHSLGREAVFVAGLSSGGAMAAILVDVYPDIFSAAGIHSGVARGAAQGVISAISVMRHGRAPRAATFAPVPGAAPVRRIVFHGDADTVVHPSNAARIVAAAVGGDATPSRVSRRSVRGRGYARSEYAGAGDAVVLEQWMLDGAGHTWSGGRAAGTCTDRKGPDASALMVRFFLAKSA